MWHRIEFVAESRRCDAKRLADFAEKNESKYGIIITPYNDQKIIEVNTWHVDQLVADFKLEEEAANVSNT